MVTIGYDRLVLMDVPHPHLRTDEAPVRWHQQTLAPVRSSWLQATGIAGKIQLGLSENVGLIFPMIYSHLIGIMISKTIGFRDTLFSDTPSWS